MDDTPAETVELHAAHPYMTGFEIAPIYGYLIHNHCWTFLGQRLGPIPDTHLAPLSNVLKIRWDDEDFGGAKSFANIQWGGGGRNSTASATLVTDPWDIPELSAMIKRCLKRGEKRKRSTDGVHGASGSKNMCPPRYLPQELKYFTLDYLGFSDVRNALAAFGW